MLHLDGLGRVLDVARPLPADQPRLLHVGLTYEPLEAAVRDVVARSLLVLALGAALAVTVVALVARLLLLRSARSCRPPMRSAAGTCACGQPSGPATSWRASARAWPG
jgi:hypothetical protein